MKPGSRVIATTKYTDNLEVCAFITPDNKIYAVVMNKSEVSLPVNVRTNGKIIGMKLPEHSIVTVELTDIF